MNDQVQEYLQQARMEPVKRQNKEVPIKTVSKANKQSADDFIAQMHRDHDSDGLNTIKEVASSPRAHIDLSAANSLESSLPHGVEVFCDEDYLPFYLCPKTQRKIHMTPK
jgi:hypothetical protein